MAEQGIHPIGEEDRQRYANLLAQVKVRMDQAGTFLDQQPPSYFSVESAALQLRTSIELVVLGSLVTNRTYVEQVSTAFRKKGWEDARKLVKSKNPKYWPVPTVKQQQAAGQYELDDVSDPYLSEAEVGRAWGDLSEWLHATNPYQSMPEPSTGHVKFCEIHHKLVTLLNHHVVNLVDTYYMAIGQMHTLPAGEIQVALFTAAACPNCGERLEKDPEHVNGRDPDGNVVRAVACQEHGLFATRPDGTFVPVEPIVADDE